MWLLGLLACGEPGWIGGDIDAPQGCEVRAREPGGSLGFDPEPLIARANGTFVGDFEPEVGRPTAVRLLVDGPAGDVVAVRRSGEGCRDAYAWTAAGSLRSADGLLDEPLVFEIEAYGPEGAHAVAAVPLGAVRGALRPDFPPERWDGVWLTLDLTLLDEGWSGTVAWTGARRGDEVSAEVHATAGSVDASRAW